MPCGFCSQTKLSGSCPVCGGAASSTFTPRTFKAVPRSKRRATKNINTRPSAVPLDRPSFPAAKRINPEPIYSLCSAKFCTSSRVEGKVWCSHHLAVWENANVPPAPPARPRTRWEDLSPATQSNALKGIRQQWELGQRNVATGMMIGLGSLKHMDLRIALMVQVDETCERVGYLPEHLEKVRDALIKDVLAELGFDPRTEAPGAKVIQFPRAEVKALGDGSLPPLVSGDWAELGRRVAMGQLTQEQAFEFGRIWTEQKGGIL